jgi:hypothetical protein
MAVLKLRKYISKHTFNDTINFWSNRPWKNPNVGKTSEREEFFLFLQILKITSAKIKPTAFTYLFPSISVLEINWKKPNTASLDFCAQTAVPYGLYGILEIRAQNLLLLYGGRTVCTDH